MPDLVRTQLRLLHRLRVRWAEVDMQGIVFNPHYLMYIDTALTEYWRAMALPYEAIPATFGGELYVKKSTLQYHGSARLDDLLDVGIRCARIGNSSMVFEAGVFRDERLLVTGELVYVFADPATQTSRPVPGVLRELFQSFEAGAAPVEIEVGHWDDLGGQASAIRRAVFNAEMGIGMAMDQDDQDAQAEHVLVRNRMGLALATARLVQEGPQLSRIARVAVIRTLRATGFGRSAVQALVQRAAQRGDTRVVLQSQCRAQGFYAQLGFKPSSEPYQQAGIAHIDMERTIEPT